MDSGKSQTILMLWLIAGGILWSTANAEAPDNQRSVVLCAHGDLAAIVEVASKMDERERSSAMGRRKSSGFFASDFFDSDRLNRLLRTPAENDLTGLFPVFANPNLCVCSQANATEIDENAAAPSNAKPVTLRHRRTSKCRRRRQEKSN